MKRYWEIIADKLSKAGWTWGCVATVDREGRTIWITDAHRGDGKHPTARLSCGTARHIETAALSEG